MQAGRSFFSVRLISLQCWINEWLSLNWIELNWIGWTLRNRMNRSTCMIRHVWHAWKLHSMHLEATCMIWYGAGTRHAWESTTNGLVHFIIAPAIGLSRRNGMDYTYSSLICYSYCTVLYCTVEPLILKHVMSCIPMRLGIDDPNWIRRHCRSHRITSVCLWRSYMLL